MEIGERNGRANLMSADANNDRRQPTVQVRQVDSPDVRETFADAILGLFFDGQSLRLNLGVTRFEQSSSSAQTNAHRVPACRLVLTPGAAIELAGQLQQLVAKLVQSGVVKPAASPAPNSDRSSAAPAINSSPVRKSVSDDPVRLKLDELADTIEGYFQDAPSGRERK